MAKSSSVLMTKGPVWKQITMFSLPLLWGYLFQQFYNTADSLIVGNFLGSSALAAVSSSSSMILLMIGFFNGIAVGAGVVIARYFGAQDDANLKRAVHTTVTFGILCGIFVSVLGVIVAPRLLVLIGTPESVLPNSIIYFRVYFAGSTAFVLYNTLVGVLRSVGDSRHPLIFLILSSALNIVLDLLFIGVFHMGVGAAAFATVIAQFVSALLCLRLLLTTEGNYQVRLRDLCLDRKMLGMILSNGIPAGIQNSVISLSNVIIQSQINRFGESAVAGCGSYSRIEGFAFIPVFCLNMAITTFVSQNLGAKEYDRARKGVRFGILASMGTSQFVAALVYVFASPLIASFSSKPDVVAFGVSMIHIVAPFYFLPAYSQIIAATLRGCGKSFVSMLIMLTCWCLMRIVYILTVVRFNPDIKSIFYIYPLSWLLSVVVFTIFYKRLDWQHALDRK